MKKLFSIFLFILITIFTLPSFAQSLDLTEIPTMEEVRQLIDSGEIDMETFNAEIEKYIGQLNEEEQKEVRTIQKYINTTVFANEDAEEVEQTKFGKILTTAGEVSLKTFLGMERPFFYLSGFFTGLFEKKEEVDNGIIPSSLREQYQILIELGEGTAAELLAKLIDGEKLTVQEVVIIAAVFEKHDIRVGELIAAPLASFGSITLVHFALSSALSVGIIAPLTHLVFTAAIISAAPCVLPALATEDVTFSSIKNDNYRNYCIKMRDYTITKLYTARMKGYNKGIKAKENRELRKKNRKERRERRKASK